MLHRKKEADSLFDQKKYYEAILIYENLELEYENLEKLAISYFNTGQYDKSEKITIKVLKNYLENDQLIDLVAFYLFQLEYSPDLTKKFLIKLAEITIHMKFWMYSAELIKKIIEKNKDDFLKILKILHLLKESIHNKSFFIAIIDDVIEVIKKINPEGLLTDTDKIAQNEFSLPEFFESIGSFENAAHAYIKIGKFATKVNKPDVVRKSIIALERLGFQNRDEVVELRNALSDAEPFIKLTESLNLLDEKIKIMPVEIPESHLKLALALQSRNLKFRSKDEYLKSIIATPILEQQKYIENLFNKLLLNDKKWAEEVFDYIISSDKLSFDILNYVKNIINSHTSEDKKSVESMLSDEDDILLKSLVDETLYDIDLSLVSEDKNGSDQLIAKSADSEVSKKEGEDNSLIKDFKDSVEKDKTDQKEQTEKILEQMHQLTPEEMDKESLKSESLQTLEKEKSAENHGKSKDESIELKEPVNLKIKFEELQDKEKVAEEIIVEKNNHSENTVKNMDEEDKKIFYTEQELNIDFL